ncbi:MAG: segregation and condensation protein A [Acidimicrobiales bacterium]
MPYAVHTDVFEGPFDVLLRLITEQRVDLYEVRLSDIVDGYLHELDLLERLDLEIATEFLLIAAILVELKSRRLLPDRDGHVSEDDLALLEERDYLLARLVECTTFSAAGQKIAALERQAAKSFPRLAGPDERFQELTPDLLAGITPIDVLDAAMRALAERPRPEVHVEHILVDEVTVAEVVGRLAAYLPGRGSTTFRELTRDASSRIEVVVHFLGLLELYKQGLIELEQHALFGEMTVTWTGGPDDEVDADEITELSAASTRPATATTTAAATASAAARARAALVEAEYGG